MARYIALVAASTLGLLLIVMLVGGIGWAQEPGGDNQTSPWPSSDPIPEGVQSQSPPDQPAVVDAADLEVAETNAYLRIAGAALKPRESNVDWSGAGGAGGCIYASGGSTSAVFNVPVYLQQGATVEKMRMYYDDTNASKNSTAWFTVYDLYGTVVSEWGVSSSGSGGNGYRTTAEFTHEVDYALYSYVINWRPYELGTDMQVCGFRIYYATAPGEVFLPLITKNYE